MASLNHPNIATIYAVEESSGGKALVMELVKGETLKVPLALEEALRVAGQVAEALEAAHEKGITHRDLKPANIMITPEGVVKVLDFGLAAISQPGAGSENPENSPTLTMGATQAGVIMGTAAYMSPEQAVGKPVDRRADIWSFGVVLLEMLTGKPLFHGETVSHILADVIRADIDFKKLPETTPRVIRDLLRRCLDRDVKTRLRDIGEARIAIQKYLANPVSDAEVPLQAQPAPSPARYGSLPWIAGGVLAVALAALAFVHFRETTPERPLVRLDVDLGADVSLTPLTSNGSIPGSSVVFSPDGMRLVYVTGEFKLFTRRLDQAKATELPGAVGIAPFFSADSQWIGFQGNTGKLNKISVEGRRGGSVG